MTLVQTHEATIAGMLCTVKIHQTNRAYTVTSFMANCSSGHAPYSTTSLPDANRKAEAILNTWAKSSITY